MELKKSQNKGVLKYRKYLPENRVFMSFSDCSLFNNVCEAGDPFGRTYWYCCNPPLLFCAGHVTTRTMCLSFVSSQPRVKTSFCHPSSSHFPVRFSALLFLLCLRFWCPHLYWARLCINTVLMKFEILIKAAHTMPIMRVSPVAK